MISTLMPRVARDADAAGIIDLIRSAFSEYPGCILDVENESPELLQIQTYFSKKQGNFWVVEEDNKIIASIGIAPTKQIDVFELYKLYINKHYRRQGLGERLCRFVIKEAMQRGAKKVQLHSDTRFLNAHRLYERLGFIRGKQLRELHDVSQSVEYYFILDIGNW